MSPLVSSHRFSLACCVASCRVVLCCVVLCCLECQQHFLLFVDPVLQKTRERGGNHHIKRERGVQSHHHRKERERWFFRFFFWRFLLLCWSLVHALFVEREGNHVAAVFRVSASHVNHLLTIPNVNTIDRKKSLTLTNSTYFT